jgi:tRNA U34 2-thiouridine synthase MnmA/TrmU
MNKKAVILLSGGLDSTLAAKMMLDEGIELIGINFVTSFCTCTKKGCRHQASKVADELGIKITVRNITEEYLEVVKNPRFGYGSGVNPCIDCRIFTFKKAKEFMETIGASFVVTGEVLGERPMSQRRDAIMIIERESGLKRLILRPLSAQLFDPTIPEEAGVINREKLLSISGRSRKPQIELAAKLNITEYPCPAGGCLLTDPQFSKRAKDLLMHNEFTLENVKLLKPGRYFRLSDSCKLVVGRNERENDAILELAKEGDILMNAGDVPAPIGLLRGEVKEKDLEAGLQIVARYADKEEIGINKDKEGKIRINNGIKMEYWRTGSSQKTSLEVEPLAEQELEKLRI